MGHINCNKIQCPHLDCEVTVESECCMTCTGECRTSSGKLIKPNESWKEDDDCTECKCVDGKKTCTAESCMPLTCKNPIKIPGICCKVCESDGRNYSFYDFRPAKSSNLILIFLAISLPRRFLKYPPHCLSTVQNFKCNLKCKSYKLSNRCPICECLEEKIEKCSFSCDADLAFMPLNDRLCECTKFCNNKCDLICPAGYEKDGDGCDLCKCKGKAGFCFAFCNVMVILWFSNPYSLDF